MKKQYNIINGLWKLLILFILILNSSAAESTEIDQDCFDTSCYYFDFNYRTFDNAQLTCISKNGHLVTISDRFEQIYIQNKIKLQLNTGDYFIGLRNLGLGNPLLWVTNETVAYSNWKTDGDPNAFGDRSCTKMNVDGSWSLESCLNVHFFICETPRDKIDYKVFSTLAPGTCPELWDSFNGYCYKNFMPIASERKNWMESREECRNYGGDLASILNYRENEFLGILTSNGGWNKYWIGLNRINTTDGNHEWSNEMPVLVQFWKIGQPNDKKDTEQCTQLQYDSNTDDRTRFSVNNKLGEWVDYNCYLSSNYICKVKSGLPPKPTTLTTISPDYYYEEVKWQKWNDSEYSSFDNSKPWLQARNGCMTYNADLVTIQSNEELSMVLGFASKMYNEDVWIGLSDLKNKSSFQWVDGSDATFVKWAAHEPDDATGRCVSMYTDSGTWRNNNCGIRMAYICKRNQKVNRREVYEINKIGNCPSDWYMYDSKCFKLFGQGLEDQINWMSALKYCQNLGPNHDLVSVHSENEMSYLITIFYNATKAVWTGLTSSTANFGWIWTDNSENEYTNWNQGEKSYDNTQGNCSVMSLESTSVGKWRVKNCTDKYAFMCQRPPDPLIKDYPNKFPACAGHSGFDQFGTSCFKFVKEKRDFDTAQSNCASQGASLAIISDVYHSSFLDFYVKDHPDYVWIGLTNSNNNGSYTWIDNSPLFYTNWPENTGTNSKLDVFCVATKSHDKWIKNDCDEAFSSVCSISLSLPPTPPKIISGDCPGEDNWFDSGQNCYYISPNEYVTWGEADHQCRRQNLDLASFHDESEYGFLKKKLNQIYQSLWIGLYRLQDDTFVWSDKSDLTFTNWYDGYPENDNNTVVNYDYGMLRSGKKNCVVVDSSGKWKNVVGRDESFGFICRKKKNGKEKINDTPKTNASPNTSIPPKHESKPISNNSSAEALKKDDQSDDSLGGGAIFGIILGVAISVVLILFIALIVLRSPNLPNFMEGPRRFFIALFSRQKKSEGNNLNSFH